MTPGAQVKSPSVAFSTTPDKREKFQLSDRVNARVRAEFEHGGYCPGDEAYVSAEAHQTYGNTDAASKERVCKEGINKNNGDGTYRYGYINSMACQYVPDFGCRLVFESWHTLKTFARMARQPHCSSFALQSSIG